MDELKTFIRDYQKRTFKDRIKEQEIDEREIKYFDNFGTVKASSIDVKKRTIEVVASKEVVDRHGDILKINGISVDRFIANPVIPWAHKYEELPVAKAVGINKDGDELIIKMQFATKELYPFADQVFNMYVEGFLNAVSVGFIPLKTTFDDELGAFMIEKSELLEASPVLIPANADALARMVKGLQGTKRPVKKKSDKKEKEDKKELTIDADLIIENGTLKETIEHNKGVMKLYRKNMVHLRDALGIEATEDEEQTIKEVMDSALVVCRLLKQHIDKSAANLSDSNSGDTKAETQPSKPKKSLISMASKMADKL